MSLYIGEPPRGLSLRTGWLEAPTSPLRGGGLRYLSEGVRASSAAYRWTSNDPTTREFLRVVPFGLRAILTSFRWPVVSYSIEQLIDAASPAGPEGGWTEEVQGIAVRGDLWYLTTTEAVWAAARISSPVPEALDHAHALDRRPLNAWDQQVVAKLGREPGRAEIHNSGPAVWYTGRKYAIDEKRIDDPVHISAPCFAWDLLFCPAEGTRKLVPSDPFWRPGPSVSKDPRLIRLAELEREKWQRNAVDGVRYQTVYIIDPDNLGYLGRIALPAADIPLGLGDGLSACCIDETSRTLVATRCSEGEGEGPINELYLYRIPDLSGLPDHGSQFSVLDVPEVFAVYPTLIAEFIGRLPIRSDDLPLAMRDVNGMARVPDGPLFINHAGIAKRGRARYEEIQKDVQNLDSDAEDNGNNDRGIHAIELLTGRVFQYVSLESTDGRLQGLAYDPKRARFLQATSSTTHTDYEVYAVARFLVKKTSG